MHYVIICITHRFARAAAASSRHHGSRCSVDDLFYSAPTVRRALHALWQHDDDIHGAAGSAQRAWGRGGAGAQCAPPASPARQLPSASDRSVVRGQRTGPRTNSDPHFYEEHFTLFTQKFRG